MSGREPWPWNEVMDYRGDEGNPAWGCLFLIVFYAIIAAIIVAITIYARA